MVDSYSRVGLWLSVYPCNMAARPFQTSNSNQRTPDHVPDISEHLRTVPDRLRSSNPEYSSTSCLDHRNHDFSKFEFLNTLKTVNGHINGKILRTFSRLVGYQEGLSISFLWVENLICKVDPILIPILLGLELNKRHTELQPKSDVFGICTD